MLISLYSSNRNCHVSWSLKIVKCWCNAAVGRKENINTLFSFLNNDYERLLTFKAAYLHLNVLHTLRKHLLTETTTNTIVSCLWWTRTSKTSSYYRKHKSYGCITDTLFWLHHVTNWWTIHGKGLVWKQASTLFFNYTFISVYKIYFFILYQRYCFGYFVCATEFYCQLLWF